MTDKQILENLRTQIDTLDDELLNLLGRRLEIVKQVGIYKKENNVAPLQNDRWESLLNDKIEKGKSLCIDNLFIKDIWNRIHAEALKIEKRIGQD